MFISHNKENRHDDNKFSIVVDGDVITLTFSINYNKIQIDKEFSLNIAKNLDKVIQVEMVNFADRGDIVIRELYRTADYALNGNDARCEPIPIARLSVSADKSDIALHIFGHISEVPEDLEIVERDWHTNISKFLCEHSAYYKQRFLKYANKVTIAQNSDIRDTLAYLEAQVDALTRLLLKSEDSDAQEILQKADKYSVLNIKDKSKLLQEIETNKAKVRGLQQSYYTSQEYLEQKENDV